MAIPTTTIRIPIMARVRLERRLSVSSIGRNASNGVTAVAERADPRDASTVTTIPKRIGMTAACQEKLNRIPSCMMLLTHMPHMSRLPSTTPSTDATKPSTAASNSTEPYSWPFFRADGAQQGECAAALCHEHLEGVGDDECRDQHGKYAEAQQEDGGDAGFARAHAFDGFLDERGTGLHAEMLREQCADLFHGGCRSRVTGIVDIEIER